MDRQKAKDLKKVLKKILRANREVLEENGVSAELGRNITYSGKDCTVKLNLLDLDEDGNTKTKAEYDFEEHCEKYGLQKTDLHKEITMLGDSYEIVGLKPRATKRPIIVKKLPNGKEYVFTAAAIKSAFRGGE